MALARVQYEQQVPGNKNFTVPFPYISRDHIKVSVDGEDVPFSWLNDSTVQLDTAPPLGAIIDVRRETERNVLLVDFQDASTLTERQLDLAAQQTFFIAQEAFDATGGTMAVANDGSYSANNRRISNVGYPNYDGDAATVKYVKDVLVSGKDAHEERLLAEAARNKAQQWADANENVQVESGKYSAKHHAIKASQSEAAAAASEAQAKTYRDQANSYKDSAAISASNAASSATAAANSATTAINEAARAKSEADRAQGYANGVNLPSAQGNGGKLLMQKKDETGLVYIAKQELAADIGLPSPIVPNTGLWAAPDGSGYQAVDDEQMLNALGIPAGKPTADPAAPITGSLLSGAMLAAGAIVEMGENANGEYWRWESGLQVCIYRRRLTLSINITTDLVGTGWYRAASHLVTWPAAFTAPPTASFTGEYSVPFNIGGVLYDVIATNGRFVLYAPQSVSSVAVLANIIAIGRWK